MPGSWEPFGSARGMGPQGEPVPPAGAAPEAPTPAAASTPPAPLRREPARRLAVITCMDARIDPLAVLGLELGDANVLRNAGATVSDDVLRSLHAAQSLLGVTRAVLIAHTDCAGHESDEAAAASVADGARRIRGAMPDSFGVEGFIYDVATGALNPV